jgi:hypothetical protein
MKLHILTAITRPENLPQLAQSLAPANLDLVWHWRFDLARAHVGGQALKNAMLDSITDGWVWILDDDTLAMPALFERLVVLEAEHPDADAFAVSQLLRGGAVRHATPDALRLDHIDVGQLIIRRDAIGDTRLDLSYGGDGLWVEALVAKGVRVVCVDEALSAYNRLHWEG